MADYEVRKISDIEEVASLKGAKALVTDSSNKARRVDLTYIHDIAVGAENNAKNGPKIVDGEWYVFDYESGEYKATGVTVLERDEFDAMVTLLASMWYFDSDGNLVTDKQVKMNSNLIVAGDTATGGTGEDTPSTGGGIDEAELAEYLSDNNYVNSVATLAAVLGYTPVNPSSLATVATSGSYTDLSNRPTSMKSPYALTINNSAGTAQVSYDGSETKSITLTKSMVGLGNVANSTYAGGTAVTLNGTSKASATASFYAPTSAGTSGQLLVSTGGAPSWVSKSSISLSAFTDDVVAGKYLPLRGGKLSGTSNTVLTVNTSATNEVGIGLWMSNVAKGWIGYNPSWGSHLYTYSGTHRLGVKDDGTGYIDNYTLIHSDNIGDYAPTLTGAGASGSWGINITGNAASATKLATAMTIWGQSFNGTGNVRGDLTLYTTTANYTGGWAYCVCVKNSSGTVLSGFGLFGGSETLKYAYIGPSYSSPHFIVTSSGNVGIGTTSPSYKLDVAGSVGIGGNLTVGGHILPTAHNTYAVGQQNKAFAYARVNVLASGAADNNMWIVGGNSTVSIGIVFARNETGGGTGAVGRWNAVGLYPDATNTLVLGQSSNRWSTIYGVDGNFSGNMLVSGDTATGSDIRFKDIIEDKTIDLMAMAGAPLFTFTWNDREDGSVHMGTSAQYWERVTPWLVKGEDFKHLDYATLGVAMAVSLAKKTVNIEERVKILERENESLKEELRRIRNGAVC